MWKSLGTQISGAASNAWNTAQQKLDGPSPKIRLSMPSPGALNFKSLRRRSSSAATAATHDGSPPDDETPLSNAIASPMPAHMRNRLPSEDEDELYVDSPDTPSSTGRPSPRASLAARFKKLHLPKRGSFSVSIPSPGSFSLPSPGGFSQMASRLRRRMSTPHPNDILEEEEGSNGSEPSTPPLPSSPIASPRTTSTTRTESDHSQTDVDSFEDDAIQEVEEDGSSSDEAGTPPPSPRTLAAQLFTETLNVGTNTKSVLSSVATMLSPVSEKDDEKHSDSDDNEGLVLTGGVDGVSDLPFPEVPMTRSTTTSHLRPSFVSVMSRADLKAALKRSSLSSPTSGSGSGMPSPASSSSGSESSVMEFSSSSSSLSEGDDVEVNDWFDESADEVVLTPKNSTLTNHRSGRTFSTTSSNASLNKGNSGHGLTFGMGSLGGSSTGRPSVNGSNSHHSFSSLKTLFSAPDEEAAADDVDEEYEASLTEFMKENMPIYEVMKQVQLFRNLSQRQQEQVLRALKPAKFSDGEMIVQQGTKGSRFYMIAKGEAVITKKYEDEDGQEKERMVTYLHPGHYFGELALIYDDPRTATVRAVGDVDLLYLTQQDFQHINQVHLSLMLQQVPLLSQLTAKDQDAVLSRLKPANFNEGEYIVHQGDEGDRFFMITRGEAIVLEADNRMGHQGEERELTRLYEGHVFGEMALIYSEPRTASIKAATAVKCLYLTKEDFDKCLLSERFQRFIQESYVDKAKKRAMRLRLQQRTSAASSASSSSLTSDDAGAVPPPPGSPAKATETHKLVRQRLKNGEVVVNRYIMKGDLGKGSFGRVKLCQSEDDGKMYAVKIMQKTFVQRMAGKEDHLQEALRREVAIMKKLSHRNVVRLVEVIDDPSSQKMYLVQEYVEHNLMDEIMHSFGLSEKLSRQYMRDLLRGLHYLHFHKVIHRDIKPENILVSSEGIAKIADFGTARMILNETETLTSVKGTPAFMAPEMFDLNATYSGPSVDVWSLGATLYMMVIGRPPWLADNEIELADKVQHDELEFPPDRERSMDPHLKHLILRMLTKDSKKRLTLNECINHPWVTNEGSEPLEMNTLDKHMTISADDSERAIENIPERIDQNLSAYLEQAHMLVKNRQQRRDRDGSFHRTGSGHSWKGDSTTPETRSGASGSNASSTSSSPSHNAVEEQSRIIRAWRHHKRVQLMYGHKELSERSRELLLEQKRVAFSAERAEATEIILPAMNPTRPRYSTSATQMRTPTKDEMVPKSPRERHNSSPLLDRSDSAPAGGSSSSSTREMSEAEAEAKSRTLRARTSFHAVTRLSEGSADRDVDMDDVDDVPTLRSATDDSLLKRSLSRKKDFLMLTSEVFRDEDGAFQSRKVLFQARDNAFSVASRAPANASSSRDMSRTSMSMSHGSSRRSSRRPSLGSNSRKSMESSSRRSMDTGSRRSMDSLRKSRDSSHRSLMSSQRSHDSSRRSMESSHQSIRSSMSCSVSSMSSNASNGDKSMSSASASNKDMNDVEDFELDGIECVEVQEENDEEGYDGEDGMSDCTSSESEFSDVDEDVDVDETFDELISAPDQLEMMSEDEEVQPVDPLQTDDFTQLDQIVQVYVSSKVRENLTLRVRSGKAEAKCSRSYMEDRTTSVTNMNLDQFEPEVRNKYSSLGYFAVYDGHNGDSTATFLQKELHNRIVRHPGFTENPIKSIGDTCEVVDNEILMMQNESEAMHKRSDALNPAMSPKEDKKLALQPISFSGSAAVMTVVAKTNEMDPAKAQTTLYVANVGDCRAVLCTSGGLAVDLTKDHKASEASEMQRIISSGGFVHNGRLDGVLALSRGFGDLAHKQDGHLIATPDVHEHTVSIEDEFLLLASDGLFDVLTSQQAVNFIYRKLRSHGDVQLAAQELVLKAQQYFAHDNVSVVIVALNQDWTAMRPTRKASTRSVTSDWA